MLYQLTEADYPGSDFTRYYYDALGNRTDVNENGYMIEYVLNDKGLNQYSSFDNVSVSYDDNGNIDRIFSTFYQYTYDCENRMTAAKIVSNWYYYKYDFAGRRVSKQTGGVTTKYCYDGDQVIAEYEDDLLKRKFIYGPGIDEPVCMIDVADSNKKYYYHFDGLGSVIALSDEQGNVVEQYEYDVFGKPKTTSSLGNPYLFTARRFDTETGLYYYRFRYYSPDLGRFMQPDPIHYLGGMNLYSYVLNNPVNWIDPWGLCKDDIREESEEIIKRSLEWYKNEHPGWCPIYLDCDDHASMLTLYLLYDKDGRYIYKYWTFRPEGRSKHKSKYMLGKQTKVVVSPTPEAQKHIKTLKPFTIDPYWYPGKNPNILELGRYEDFVKEYPYKQD